MKNFSQFCILLSEQDVPPAGAAPPPAGAGATPPPAGAPPMGGGAPPMGGGGAVTGKSVAKKIKSYDVWSALKELFKQEEKPKQDSQPK